MKKIVFGITSLRPGGAERVLIDIVNKLCNKYDITVFTLYGEGSFEKQLSKKVKHVTLNEKSFESLSFFKRKIMSLRVIIPFLRNRIYKKYIKDFDVKISFLEGPITWIFGSNDNSYKVAWVHNDIKDVFNDSKSNSIIADKNAAIPPFISHTPNP